MVKLNHNERHRRDIYLPDLGSKPKNFFVGLDGRIQAKGIDIDGKEHSAENLTQGGNLQATYQQPVARLVETCRSLRHV